MTMIDIYNLLPEDWFEEFGQPSNDMDQYAPIDYDLVCTALYTANSFFGPEYVALLVDEDKEIYYIRSGVRQPIGDYAWETIWFWYKSDPSRYAEIKAIIEKATENSAIDSTPENP